MSESVIVTDQTVLFLILGAVFGFLLWGRVRYDLVAFGALVVAVIAGVDAAIGVERETERVAVGAGDLLDRAVEAHAVDLAELPAGIEVAVGPPRPALGVIEARRELREPSETHQHARYYAPLAMPGRGAR